MINTTLNNPVLPSEQDMQIATETSRKLATLKSKKGSIHLEINGEILEMPVSITEMILDMLEQTANGKAIKLLLFNAEMTSQQAADFLNVSRPFFIQLLDKKLIPFYKVGTHRRIRFEDVVNYKKAIDEKRLKTLDKLAEQAQELDMGY